VIETFQPLIDAAHGVDLSDPAAARRSLGSRFDPTGAGAAALNDELLRLLEEGRVAERGELPVRWGRVAKASEDTRDLSIDVVLMNGPGPRHRHPGGEVNYCVAVEGSPTFDGEPPGWVVKAPDSTHVPTVEGGTMLIVYLLPGGAMEFVE